MQTLPTLPRIMLRRIRSAIAWKLLMKFHLRGRLLDWAWENAN